MIREGERERERESVIRIESCGFLFAPSNTYMTGQEHYKLLLLYFILFYSFYFIYFVLFIFLNSLGHMCSDRLRNRNDSRLSSRSLSNPIFHLHTQYSIVQYNAVQYVSIIRMVYGTSPSSLPPSIPACLHPSILSSLCPILPLSLSLSLPVLSDS